MDLHRILELEDALVSGHPVPFLCLIIEEVGIRLSQNNLIFAIHTHTINDF